MSRAHPEQAFDRGVAQERRFTVWNGALAVLLLCGIPAAGLIPVYFFSQRKDDRLDACREQVVNRFHDPHLLRVINAAGFLGLKISVPETMQAAKGYREYAGSGVVTVEAPELVAAIVNRQTGQYNPSASGIQYATSVKKYAIYPFQNPLAIKHGVITTGPMVPNSNLKNGAKLDLMVGVAADCIVNQPIFGGVAEVDRWTDGIPVGSVVLRNGSWEVTRSEASSLPTTFSHAYSYIYGEPQP